MRQRMRSFIVGCSRLFYSFRSDPACGQEDSPVERKRIGEEELKPAFLDYHN